MAKKRELKTRKDGIKQHYTTGSSVTSNADARAAFNPRPVKKGKNLVVADATENARGFNDYGLNEETRTRYDRDGFDFRGFDRYGINRETGTNYDRDGFSQQGFHRRGKTRYSYRGLDLHGFDRYGVNRETGTKYDRDGFNSDGYNKDSRYRDGDIRDMQRGHFGADGLHSMTGTRFNPFGFDRDRIHVATGTKYDPDGFDFRGRGEDGFTRSGFTYDPNSRVFGQNKYFDRDGYNSENIDRNGFHFNGQHERTGTLYDPAGFDRDGFDEYGCNREDVNQDGIPRSYVVPLACAGKTRAEILRMYQEGIPPEFAVEL